MDQLDDATLKEMQSELLDLSAFVADDDETDILVCSVLRLGEDTLVRLECQNVAQFLLDLGRLVLREDQTRWERAFDERSSDDYDLAA